MSNALKGRTNMPKAERGQGIPEVELSDYWKGFFEHEKKPESNAFVDSPTLKGIYRTDGVQAGDVEKALAVIELRQKLKNVVKLMDLLKEHPDSTHKDMQHLHNQAKEIDAKAESIFYSLPMNMQYALHNFDK